MKLHTGRAVKTALAAVVALAVAPPVAGAAPAEKSVRAASASSYAEDFDVSAAEADRRIALQGLGHDLVDAAREALGERFGGVWFDNERGRFRIGVDGPEELPAARSLLAERELERDADVVVVKFTWAELTADQRRLDERLAELIERGTVSTGIDTSVNAVVVQLSDRATAKEEAVVSELVAGVKTHVEIRTVKATQLDLRPAACAYPACDRPLRGGVEIYAFGVSTCTAGFIATNILANYVLTAGHCGVGNYHATHRGSGYAQPIGPVDASYNDAWSDAQAIRINGGWWDVVGLGPYVAAWTVNAQHVIWGTASSWVGQYTCKFGRTVAINCGNVLLVNSTEYVADHTVYGFTRVAGCAAGGDSGGPVITDSFGYGLVAASDFACSIYVYNEIKQIEARIGVRVATAG